MNWPFFGLVCRGHSCNLRRKPNNASNTGPGSGSFWSMSTLQCSLLKPSYKDPPSWGFFSDFRGNILCTVMLRPFRTQREAKIADFMKSLELGCGQVNSGQLRATICCSPSQFSAPPYVVPYRVGWELASRAANCGSELPWISLSTTQFETFQELGDFGFWVSLGSERSQL